MRKTTSDKIMSYLSMCARRAGSNSFDIPYSRQQLAEYLSVEKSALSRELGTLSRKGMFTFEKNHFTLLAD